MVTAGLAVLFGVLLGKWIEYPALALRDRLFPRTGVNPYVTSKT